MECMHCRDVSKHFLSLFDKFINWSRFRCWQLSQSFSWQSSSKWCLFPTWAERPSGRYGLFLWCEHFHIKSGFLTLWYDQVPGKHGFWIGGHSRTFSAYDDRPEEVGSFCHFEFLKSFFFNQVLNTHDHDRRVLHLKGALILPLNHEHWPLILRVCSATPTCSLNMYVSLSQRIFNNILDYHIILDTTHHGSPVVRLSDDLWLRTGSCQWSRLQFKRVKHSWWF